MTEQLEIVKEHTFEAAHYFGDMPDGHIYKNVHGHSFHVAASLVGTRDPEHGWVVDFAEFHRVLSGACAELDHNLLNSVAGLENPSLENIAIWFARRLHPRFPQLKSVTVRRPSCGEAAIYHLGSR